VERGSPAAAGNGTEAPRFFEVARESGYVAVRDGTRLAVSIYRPARNGKAVTERLPVVFVFTPYRARYRDDTGKIVETGLSEQLGLKGLTDHGYVVAVADIRGKGASFGHRRGFQDRTEAQDGHDLVQWLAGQPWSSGKVGMTGCSYVGGTTLQVASTTPPALKAIFTGAADLDKYMFVRRGGITAQFNTRPDEPLSVDLATLPVDEDRDGSMLRAAVAEHADNTSMAALWYDMPYRDSVSSLVGTRFWEEVGPATYLDQLKASGIATYFWGNWQDEPTEQMILAAANLGGKLLVGPGLHCAPPPGFDFSGEVRRFFDWQLKGVANGMNRQARATWWIDQAAPGGEWVSSDRLPGAGAVRRPLFLTKDAMVEAAPAAGETRFVVDYDVGPAEAFALWPKSAPGKGISYTSAPMSVDRTMLGGPIASLTVSLDRPDANLFVYLEDVAPDGSIAVVSQGRLAVSHRKIARAPYDTLGMPWHSSRKADVAPLAVGEKAVLAIPMLPSARVIRKGHSLRLVVAGADPRQRNLAQIRVTPPPQLTLWHGVADPARLEMPWID
jgi:putative CocE/NonD family hydrolase